MRKNFKNQTNKIKKKDTNGITLIALVITIIVLLILAGISISAISGNNSIINRTITAKEQNEISEEKEALELSVTKSMGKNKYGNLLKDELEEQLNIDLGEGTTEVTSLIKNMINVKFTKSGRDYQVDVDGEIYSLGEMADSEIELTNENANLIGFEKGVTTELNIPGIFINNGKKYIITSFGNNLFYGDETLKKVVIPDTVKTIKEGFLKETNIEEVIIGSGVSEIGDDCLSSNYKLNKINVSSANEKFMSKEGVLFSKSGKTLMIYPIAKNGEYIVPNGVETIGYCAFEKSHISNIQFPNTLKRISGFAFSDCDNLKSISLPNSVQSIGNGVFMGCKQLTSVNLSDDLVIIGDYAFFNVPNSNDIIIPGNVKKIGEYAFDSWNRKVIFNNYKKIESVGDYAFSECIISDSEAKEHLQLLNEFSIQNSGSGGFGNIPTYDFVEILSNDFISPGLHDTETYELIKTWNDLVNEGIIVVLNGGINTNTSKATSALNGRLIIDGSISKINSGCFSDCSNLKSIEIPNNITNIGPGAFMRCTSLEAIILPNNLDRIEDQTFEGCTNLKIIELQNGLKSIGNATFQNCTKLELIEIPDSVTELKSVAFNGCTNLKHIKIGNGLKTFTSGMLIGVQNLENLTIGTGLEKIEDGAFSSCNKLKDIYYKGTQQQWNQIIVNVNNGNNILSTVTMHYNQ